MVIFHRFLGLFTGNGHPQELGPWYVLAGPGNGNHALGDRSQFQCFRWGRVAGAAPGAMGNPTLMRCALIWETGDVVGYIVDFSRVGCLESRHLMAIIDFPTEIQPA